jgi:hypothetical protein
MTVQPNSFSYSLCVFSLILLALWQTGSCKGGKATAMSQQQNRVAAGNWGGQNAHLEVSEGGAQIRFSCAHGSVEEPLTLDAEGRFNAKGLFVAESMGPTYEGNPPKSRAAVYSGVVRDKKMTLTVTVTGDKDESGTYELTQGESGHVHRCH